MESQAESETKGISTGTALKFVILLGVVSLFADMTYEGARSVTGPYLAILGASATVVGIVAGFGELIGYALRLVSGYISDRTGKYWTVTLFGIFRQPAGRSSPGFGRELGNGRNVDGGGANGQSDSESRS